MRLARVYGLWNRPRPLLAGAVLLHPLGAQVRDTVTKRRDSTVLAIPVPPGADSLLRDSLAKRDIRAQKRDSVKAPTAHSEIPVEIGIAQTLRWTRDSIYTTGAITLADLLKRVPGVSVYQRRLDRRPGVGGVPWRFPSGSSVLRRIRDARARSESRRRSRPDPGQPLGRRGSRHRAGAGGNSRVHPHLARSPDDRGHANRREHRRPTDRISIADTSADATTAARFCSSARSSMERPRPTCSATAATNLG